MSRWLMGVWFLATLVLMNTYSGLLVASLTVPRVAVPIASVQQLVDQSALPWRLERGGIILHTFKVRLLLAMGLKMERLIRFFYILC